jgi:hypothetical protein
MENSRLRRQAPTSVNVTVGKRGREYLTEREVERLMEAAKQNRSGHRDATAILVAYRHGFRASEIVALRWDDVDLTNGRLHVRRPRAGMPVCIRYQPGKVGRCASSCAKHQHRPTSLSRNVAHRFPQPDISAWLPGRAWLRNLASLSTPTCCGWPLRFEFALHRGAARALCMRLSLISLLTLPPRPKQSPSAPAR